MTLSGDNCDVIHTHVHIEKTAGTSVQNLLEQCYGPRYVFVYNPTTDTFMSAADRKMSNANPLLHRIKLAFGESLLLPYAYRFYVRLVRRVNRGVPTFSPCDLPEYARAVIGHFKADILDEYRGDKQFRTVLLRDPLERMISQYLHWRRDGGPVLWRYNVLFDPMMPFGKYAMLEPHHNYQTQALANRCIKDFDVVGVVEWLDHFGSALILNGCSPKVERLNISPRRHTMGELGITEDFIDEFREANAMDYENYELARQMAKEMLGEIVPTN